MKAQIAPLMLHAKHNVNANIADHGSPHNACAVWLLPAGNSHLPQLMSHLYLTVIHCSSSLPLLWQF